MCWNSGSLPEGLAVGANDYVYLTISYSSIVSPLPSVREFEARYEAAVKTGDKMTRVRARLALLDRGAKMTREELEAENDRLTGSKKSKFPSI